MAFNTSSWSVKEEVKYKAKLKLDIPNFSEIVRNTPKGQWINSKKFDVGGGSFTLHIYPDGHLGAKKGMLSAFLCNESDHDVVVDIIISVEGTFFCERYRDIKIEKGGSWGKMNFMKASVVGTDLEYTVEVELKWKDFSGGVVEKNQVDSKNLVQVEERLGGKLDQMGGKLEQMKTFVLAELNQQQQEMKNFVRGEIAKVKATSIPECPVCFLQLKPPKKIVQCLKGHKICETCSEKEAVVSCPTCKTAFMGRDFGMEAFVRELSGEN